jgi:hypothetical protein
MHVGCLQQGNRFAPGAPAACAPGDTPLGTPELGLGFPGAAGMVYRAAIIQGSKRQQAHINADPAGAP